MKLLLQKTLLFLKILVSISLLFISACQTLPAPDLSRLYTHNHSRCRFQWDLKGF